MKPLSIILLLCCLVPFSAAQTAPERSTPYTAVRWDGDLLYAMIGGEWYQILAIDGVKVTDIAEASKSKYRKSWRKRMSLDLTEVLVAMEHPLPETVNLSVRRGEKALELTEKMTTQNKNAVWKHMKEHPVAEDPDAGKKADKLQRDIAKSVNLKMDKPFKIKAAKIEFVVDGSKLFAGKETLYFDDHGNTVILVTDKPGVLEAERTTTIWKDNKTTVIDHLKQNYYTTPIRPKATEPWTISYSTETQRKQAGYIAQPSQSICGKECEVYKHSKMNVSYWLWKGLALKEINYAVGGDLGYTKEAKTVEEIAGIPSSMFDVPASYTKK